MQQTTQLTGAAGLVAAVAAVLVAVALAPRLDAAPVKPALKLVAATTCRRRIDIAFLNSTSGIDPFLALH